MYFSSSLGGVEVAVAVSGESVLAGWRPVEGGHGPGRRHAPTLPAIWSIHRRIHSLAAGRLVLRSCFGIYTVQGTVQCHTFTCNFTTHNII